MERPFIIRSIEIVPVAGVAVGQFVDVLVSTDDDDTDTVTPTGSSIFEGSQNLSLAPTGDGDVGLPVSALPYDVPMAKRVHETGRTLKVVVRAIAPAVSVPAVHVVVVVAEFEQMANPIAPRPPIGPGPDHPEAPPYAPLPDPAAPQLPVVPVLPAPSPTVPVPHDQPWLAWTFPTNCAATRTGRPSGRGVARRSPCPGQPWPWQLATLPAAEREIARVALVTRAARF